MLLPKRSKQASKPIKTHRDWFGSGPLHMRVRPLLNAGSNQIPFLAISCAPRASPVLLLAALELPIFHDQRSNQPVINHCGAHVVPFLQVDMSSGKATSSPPTKLPEENPAPLHGREQKTQPQLHSQQGTPSKGFSNSLKATLTGVLVFPHAWSCGLGDLKTGLL